MTFSPSRKAKASSAKKRKETMTSSKRSKGDELNNDDDDDDDKKKRKKKTTTKKRVDDEEKLEEEKTKIKSRRNQKNREEEEEKSQPTRTLAVADDEEKTKREKGEEEEEEEKEKKISPREWFALLEDSSSRYREHLERLKYDPEAEEEMEKEEEEDIGEKKKSEKNEEGINKQRQNRSKEEMISPYDALDSGSLLFEDMWNVRSRAMEEYAVVTPETSFALIEDANPATLSALTGTARERLKKIIKDNEKKEDGDEAAIKEFNGIKTLEEFLVQKKSQLSKILDPVCHYSASNLALKEPTTSEQLSRLPHERWFTKIHYRESTTEERVERLKMIAYVLNLKLPSEVCQKRTSSAIRGFQGQMKEVLTRLKSLAFACARHELFEIVGFLTESNLVTKEMTNNKARERTLQNAQIVTAIISVMISLLAESNEKAFQAWQKLEYSGGVSASAVAKKINRNVWGDIKLDFDNLKRLARILRKKLHARNTITTPEIATNKKGEGAPGKRSLSPMVVGGGKEPDDDDDDGGDDDLERMEHDQVMKGKTYYTGDGTKQQQQQQQQQQQTNTTKITTGSLLTHYSYLSESSDMILEDSDIIGRCIYSMPIISFAVSRFRAFRWKETAEGTKINKAFVEVFKLGHDVISRLSAIAGDMYGAMSPQTLQEAIFTSGEEVIVADNLSRWYAPDFIESKEMYFYSESIQMPVTYDRWILMPHVERRSAFCHKLVAFFVAAHDAELPSPRTDICRTLCVLKYHKHLVNIIKRDLVDRLFATVKSLGIEESGNVEAASLASLAVLLPMREFPGQYGSENHQILYKLTAKLNILKEMARGSTPTIIFGFDRIKNNYEECAMLIVKETNILPIMLQLLGDIPPDAIMMQKATGGRRSIALDLELASLFEALCEKKQVREEVLNYEEGAFVPLVVTRLLDMLSPSSSSTITSSSTANNAIKQLETYEYAMCASPTYWMKKSVKERANLKNNLPRPGVGSYQTLKKGTITAEIIQYVSECVANMNGKIVEINKELDKRDFSSVLLKLLERKEASVKESVSAAIIAMDEHKKIIGKIEKFVENLWRDRARVLTSSERDALKSMMRSITELVKETPTVPDVIDRVVSRTRTIRWMERILRESEEHIYDNLKNTEKGMASLKSFEEECGTGSLVKWNDVIECHDLENAFIQVVSCVTPEVLKFRNYYDEEDQNNMRKTKLYKAIRVYVRLFRAKVAVGSLGLPEGTLSNEVYPNDPTFLATGKHPSVLELNLAETMISALANLRLEDACDVMVEEGMVESVKSLIEVLGEINDRVAILLDAVKDEKDPRIISVSDVLKEACYCMSLLASKSCHQDRVADAGVIPVLVKIISGFNSEQKEKPQDPVAITSSVARRAADAITNLAHENHAIKSTVRHDGGIPPLISLLNCVHDVKVQRAAAAALRTLAFKNPENKNQIVEEGALKMLLFMVRSEDSSVHKEAVGVIGNLVHSSLPIKKRVLDEGALQPVIGLLSSTCLESQREAALLLGQFAATEPKDYNMTRIVQRGAIVPLVEMLKNSDPGLREMAAFALGRLAQNADNQIGICFGAGLGPLLKLLDSNIDDIMMHLRETNSSAKKPDSELKGDARRYVENLQHNAAFALYGLSDNEDNVHVIIAEGSVQRFRDANNTLLLEASKTCVEKTLQRLEEKLTSDKNKKCREYLRYLMTTEPKHAKKFRIAVAFAHLCNKKDMQDIFLESGGLKILIDVLVKHAWNKTGHKTVENGVSFSRPGTHNIQPRRYFLKSLAYTPSGARKEVAWHELESFNPDSIPIKKSIAAITEKLANVQKTHGHCLTASSLLSSGATGANVREAVDAITSIVEKTKRDGLGNSGPEVSSEDEFIELDDDDYDDAAHDIVSNKYVSEISTQIFPQDNTANIFNECFQIDARGFHRRERLWDNMISPLVDGDTLEHSKKMEIKMKSDLCKNLDLCDVVFTTLRGASEYRVHRIALAHTSEKFLKLIEAGCSHVKSTKRRKKDEEVCGVIVGEEEDPGCTMMDDDDDDDGEDDDNEKDKVLCRVKIDCSELALKQLLHYLYFGTFLGFPPGPFNESLADLYIEVLNVAREHDLDGLVREVELSFKSLFTLKNYLKIMYHPAVMGKSEVITQLGWQYAFEKKNVHRIVELYGLNYYTMMMHDDEEKLTTWLSDRIKNARDFTRGGDEQSGGELEEDGEGPEESEVF